MRNFHKDVIRHDYYAYIADIYANFLSLRTFPILVFVIMEIHIFLLVFGIFFVHYVHFLRSSSVY